MATIKPKKRGDKSKTTEIFCYTCKEYITVHAKKREEAIRLFHESGHRSKPVKELAPNVGRGVRALKRWGSR